MKRITLALTIIAASLTGCKSENPILDIEGGKIQGVQSDIKGVTVFKGIPFAAAPTGDNRWREPQPIEPWEGVLLADTYSAGSMQKNHDSTNSWTSEFYWEDPDFSEDCLYLNVFTPAAGKAGRNLPVAMWIHGGAYTGGWSWEPEFEGKYWAEKGVVLVTINYRLGIFGFMCHPFLSAESPNGVSGNYGLLDQIAALKWIHNNIAAFGGDPDNITILGQSAGAGSVKALVSSPLTDGLISKAIIQSGGGVNFRPKEMDPLTAGEQMNIIGERFKKVLDWAGYDTLEKMRAASTDEIFTLPERYVEATGEQIALPTRPVIDGYVSTESFDDATVAGRIKDIPYMIGYTKDDLNLGGPRNEAVVNFCNLRCASSQPVYAYIFNHELPDDEAGSHDMKGAFHSSELWFMFKSLENSDRPFTPADYELGEHMLNCWTSFAKTGDPANGWLPYTQDNKKFMLFDLNEESTEDISGMGE